MIAHRILRILIYISISLAISFLILVISVPWLLKDLGVEQRFRDKMKSELGLMADFDRFSISILPVPRYIFTI